ncbi:hypothetical protein Q5H93_16070 [Hymenobacter sp. ASUV-10]|uniref:Septum formation inhibitor Maf n=1 Tax=Hymenobacter aranciens TaxID=3063996 RepID=A0ABT9BDC0_9BACT|nr:hypothetical protein [Hymenobacter sp. ASUV-10]MDO7876262.1 hypothetical protein [Hymenobacter sp. ASUV-10]
MKFLLVPLFLALSCSSAPGEKPPVKAAPLPAGFGAYWFQGKAELSSYTLEQARYGEIHQGEAVLIFVTEDFSRSKQVKLDDPTTNPDDRLPVLKLNFEKKFLTGIYPYSLLTSTFTPLDQSPTVKVSTSVQEWCGHIFTQLNLRRKQYHVSLKSYFESEGDRETDLPITTLEDELWNRIRLNPAGLPVGAVQLVPGTTYTRLQHQPLQAEAATATLAAAPGTPRFGTTSPLQAYTLKYQSGRRLVIYFEQAFPHRILGWDETYLDRAGSKTPRELTTRATRHRTLQLDYWRTHHHEHLGWRDSLGLRK